VNEPLFSIVTVTLNCAEDATRTAQSILAQSFGDYQYVVKDGGSTDGTPERVRELGVAVHESADHGVYNAMNQALRLCTGRYICFMNAGDLFPSSETLAQVAQTLSMANDPDFAYGDVQSYTNHPLLQAGQEPDGMREIQYPDRLNRFYLFRKMICHQAWFVRRTLYVERGGLDEHYKLLADYAFLMDMVAGKDLRYVHIPAVTAIFQGGGLSERQTTIATAERTVIQRRAFNRMERLFYGTAYYGARGLVHKILYDYLYPRLSPALRRRINGS